MTLSRRPKRRIGKWAGLSLVLLILGLYAASAWCVFIASTLQGHVVTVVAGGVIVDWPEPSKSPWEHWRLHATYSPGRPFTWTWGLETNPRFGSEIALPLWLVALVPAIPTAWLWWSDRQRKGFCRDCDYDLRGLAAGAKCPECGRGGGAGSAPV